MSSSWGKAIKVTTFGESHGGGVGVVIDGLPGGIAIDLERVQAQWLDRRKPGQSDLTTSRQEHDRLQCLSGLDDGLTLGSPVMILVGNKDQRPGDYKNLEKTYRPSHADYTYKTKYGVLAKSGGGRSSARETIGRVAAAGVLEQYLQTKIPDLKCRAWVHSVGEIKSKEFLKMPAAKEIESSPVRCPDSNASKKMEDKIRAVKEQHDSIGGTIICRIEGVPVGLGEPIFDKLESDLAKAMLSIPASKGFEIGSGFDGTLMLGSKHNDEFYKDSDNNIRTHSNHSGGIQGGLSNGEAIYFKVAFKPTSTIAKAQSSVTESGEGTTLVGKGRHDPCVLPRAIPIVEAMTLLTIGDHFARNIIHQR